MTAYRFPDARIIGLISDTHGLLRPQALHALQGVDLILHAGDVGNPTILDKLGAIALTVAVRGNVDTDAWALRLPETAVVETDPAIFYILHDVNKLDLSPKAACFHCVLSGHSHKPKKIERDGVLFINPGSAGPRRFALPICLARLDLNVDPWHLDFIDLDRL